MNASCFEPSDAAPGSSLMLVAREGESPWEARGLGDLVPPATLLEARARRDELTRLLGRERSAAADFLLALADFDRRRGWERLGHASLFAFLTRELGLSNAAAWYRLTGARLLPRFPDVEAALRDGRLCLTVVGELSKVLTSTNAEEVLPRFFGRSSREAKEVVAALLPCPTPPRRDVARALPASVPAAAKPACPPATLALNDPSSPGHGASGAPALALATGTLEEPLAAPLRAREVAPTHPAQGPRAAVRPLTEELRRLSVTVSARFLEKVATARIGLSHALPGATTEQVLEAALDLLLEQQARRKAQVKRPRKARAPASTTTSTPTRLSAHPERSAPGAESRGPTSTPTARPHVPAEIEREVRLRDGDRCQFPLDAGGVCGSTRQVQLDHVQPRALEGPTTAANLRCACAFHNRYAAELALGPAVAGIRRRRSAAPRKAASHQLEGGGA